MAKAAKVNVDGGRLLGETRGANPHRIFDVIVGDDLVVVHICWPNMPCWGS